MDSIVVIQPDRERCLLRRVKRVRNNLFHGGKLAESSGHIEDRARNRPLLDACVTLLKACLDLSLELEENIPVVS